MTEAPSLWEAFLHPRGHDLLPSARDSTWTARRDALHERPRSLDVHSRIRSPAALWSLLKNTPIPRGATWALLFQGSSWQALMDALTPRGGHEFRGLISWNVRSMADQHTNVNQAKRNRIRRWLDAGRIVLLQETHWDQGHAAAWSQIFPAAALVASPAVSGQEELLSSFPPPWEW